MIKEGYSRYENIGALNMDDNAVGVFVNLHTPFSYLQEFKLNGSSSYLQELELNDGSDQAEKSSSSLYFINEVNGRPIVHLTAYHISSITEDNEVNNSSLTLKVPVMMTQVIDVSYWQEKIGAAEYSVAGLYKIGKVSFTLFFFVTFYIQPILPALPESRLRFMRTFIYILMYMYNLKDV